MRTLSLQVWGVPQASKTGTNDKGLSRLISAAVVNREFCSLLLADPAGALTTGYNGESFQLPMEEQELVRSIHATSLADFAQQLSQNGNGNGNGNGHSHNYNGNGNGHNGHKLGPLTI